MNKYKTNTHHRCDEQLYEGTNIHTRIRESEHFYLYEVSREDGATYYEMVKRGNVYHQRENQFDNSQLEEGDEMYPINEEFGKWGWCYSDKKIAEKRFYKANQIACSRHA